MTESGKLLMRIMFDHDSYFLLTELEGDEWRVTRKHLGHHVATGTGRVQGVAELARQMAELFSSHLVLLQEEERRAHLLPDVVPGFRPGNRARVLAKLRNQREGFLKRIRASAMQAGQYLLGSGWPTPEAQPLGQGVAPLEFMLFTGKQSTCVSAS